MKCPICKKGEIKNPKKWLRKGLPDKRIMGRLLRKEGYSFREIMRFLGYKSTNSVVKLIK